MFPQRSIFSVATIYLFVTRDKIGSTNTIDFPKAKLYIFKPYLRQVYYKFRVTQKTLLVECLYSAELNVW